MDTSRLAIPVLALAGLGLFAGCTGKSAPPGPTEAPPAAAAPSASTREKNAPQGGGVDLDKDQPDGGGVKNP
jgi:hypothetical protein